MLLSCTLIESSNKPSYYDQTSKTKFHYKHWHFSANVLPLFLYLSLRGLNFDWIQCLLSVLMLNTCLVLLKHKKATGQHHSCSSQLLTPPGSQTSIVWEKTQPDVCLLSSALLENVIAFSMWISHVFACMFKAVLSAGLLGNDQSQLEMKRCKNVVDDHHGHHYGRSIVDTYWKYDQTSDFLEAWQILGAVIVLGPGPWNCWENCSMKNSI